MSRVFQLRLWAFLVLSFLLAGTIQSSTHAAPTTLAPGDIVIVTVNAETTYSASNPCGSANSFDFIPLVDLGSGTVIKFADEGWDGTSGDWRTGSEGVVIYTAPTDIVAGQTIHYEDCYISSTPSVWSMDSIPAAGAGSFDLSVSGDNILAYQGDDSSPNFLYGIGWARGASWITTGSLTTNNSYVPPALSSGASTIVNLASQDNYQLFCSSFDVSSSGFLASIADPTNWEGHNSTIFPTITGVCPQVQINQVGGQSDPVSVDSAVFEVVFSEPIIPAMFTSSDIGLSGTSGTVTAGPVETGPVDGTTFQFSVTGMTAEDTVVAIINFAATQSADGDDSSASTSIDNSVTYDPVAPDITFITELTPGSIDQDSFSVSITDFMPDAASYRYILTDNSLCDATTDFSSALALISGTDVNIIGDSNNGNYICIQAVDIAGNVSYLRSTDPVSVVLSAIEVSDTGVAVEAESLADTGLGSGAMILTGSILAISSILLYIFTPLSTTKKVKIPVRFL